MPVFYPNEGELLMMMASVDALPLTVGLFRNQVPQDGGVTFTSFTQLTTGGGRAYATVNMDNAISISALTTAQWYLYTNSSGKAEADYCFGTPPTARTTWTFNAIDEADGYSVYGAFAWATLIPFDAGATEIRKGDIIKGGTSGAYATVAKVILYSGSWGAGTAAGYLIIKSQSGTFQDNENLLILGEAGTVASAPTNGGTGYGLGDIVQITTVGTGCLCVVTAQGAGIVTSVVKVVGGKNYTTGAGKATTKVTGTGNDDLTLNISALATTAYAVSNTGTLFAGDSHKKVVLAYLLTTPIEVAATVPIYYTPWLTGSTA